MLEQQQCVQQKGVVQSMIDSETAFLQRTLRQITDTKETVEQQMARVAVLQQRQLELESSVGLLEEQVETCFKTGEQFECEQRLLSHQMADLSTHADMMRHLNKSI